MTDETCRLMDLVVLIYVVKLIRIGSSKKGYIKLIKGIILFLKGKDQIKTNLSRTLLIQHFYCTSLPLNG